MLSTEVQVSEENLSPKEKALHLIDEIISEPLGGAHRNYDQVSSNLSKVILKNLDELTKLPINVLIEKRYERLMSYGSI